MIYPTLLAAAMAALQLASGPTVQDHHEWAGVLLQTPSGYTYTAPERGTHEHFRLVLQIPRGDKIVALYHTHDSAEADPSTTDRFSEADISVAFALHVPSFIWVQYTHRVREFVPRGSVADYARDIVGYHVGGAPGRIVGTLR